MTAPNLTPAEALECLRDLHGDGKSLAAWDAKWKRLRVYGMTPCIRAISALETLLSEHEATKAKLAAYERDHLMRPDNRNDPTALSGVETHYGKPAAAVPNASEGVESLQRWFNTFRIVDASGNARFLECIVAVDGALTKAVAAVPSDEDGSIRNLFHLIDATGVEKPREIKAMLCYLIGVTKKLAKRIGVKL